MDIFSPFRSETFEEQAARHIEVKEATILNLAGAWRGSAIIDLIKDASKYTVYSYSEYLAITIVQLQQGLDPEIIIDHLLEDIRLA